MKRISQWKKWLNGQYSEIIHVKLVIANVIEFEKLSNLKVHVLDFAFLIFI